MIFNSNKKILIITSSYDLTVDYIVKKYGRECNFIRLNTDELQSYEIYVQNKNDFFEIKSKDYKIKSDDIYSIYYRKPALPDLSKYELKYHTLMYKEILSFIEGIVESFERKCLSKPSVLKKADNKILQMKLARDIGFGIPSSLITNSEYIVSSFIDRNTHSIVKPLSIGRIINKNDIDIIQTNLVSEEYNLNELKLSPAYFQEYIEKQYELRVTIIDDKVYAVKIKTDEKVDWRKAKDNIQYVTYELPKKIKKMCFVLMEKLNLKFGAFDFIVDNKDEFYFLEINANGQWCWLENILDLNISESIINYLRS